MTSCVYDPSTLRIVAVRPDTGEHVHVSLPELAQEVHVIERTTTEIAPDVADAMREMADQIVTLKRQVHELQELVDAMQSIEIYKPKDAA